MSRLLSRAPAFVGTLGALACALGTAGCAKDPTELYVYVGADATVTQAITSILVTVTGTTNVTSRAFQSLDNAAPDADIPTFRFPAFLDLQLTRDGISGPVVVEVDASDPTMSTATLATASAPTTLQANKTTSLDVVLTAVPQTGGGGAGGAGADGVGGADGLGGAGGDGAGGMGGAGGDGAGGMGGAGGI